MGIAKAWPLVAATLGCAAEDEVRGDHEFRFGGCLPGGVVSICEDPITGVSPEADVVGGTMLPTGFRVDEKNDHITFDLGDDATEGAVRFTLTGIGPESLAQDTLLLLLATDTPALRDPEPTRVLELKIWGSAVDPAQSGNTRFGAGDLSQEAVRSAGILDYDPAQTYEYEVSWNHDTQRLTLALDGEMVLDFMTGDQIPGPDNESIDMRYRYVHVALPELPHPAFWPIVGGVYGSVSIIATVPNAGESSGGASETSTSEASTSEPPASDTSETTAEPTSPASSEEGDGDAPSSESGTAASGALPGFGERPPATGCACDTASPRSHGHLLALLVLMCPRPSRQGRHRAA